LVISDILILVEHENISYNGLQGGYPPCKKISPMLVKIFGYIFPHRFAGELYMVGIMHDSV